MNPIETQIAEYFSWLDADLGQLEPVQHTSVDESSGTRLALLLAIAAAVIGVFVALSFVIQRRADLSPAQLPEGSTTTVEQSTVPDPSPLGPELASTELATVLSDAGVDMSRLPDTVMAAISEVASGASHLCGFEDPQSPRNETGISLNSAARRCFVDSYLIGSPAVLVLQGPTYLTPPGVYIWSTRVDRNVTIDEASADAASGQGGVWTLQQCGGLSTDSASSADPPEFFHCAAATLTLVAEEPEAPAWFVERVALPLCGYSMPSSEDDDGAICFTDSLASGEPAEYVIAGADGLSVAWIRSLGAGLYERIDWVVSGDGVTSWARTRCTISDTPEATLPPFGGDRSYSCEAI